MLNPPEFLPFNAYTVCTVNWSLEGQSEGEGKLYFWDLNRCKRVRSRFQVHFQFVPVCLPKFVHAQCVQCIAHIEAISWKILISLNIGALMIKFRSETVTQIDANFEQSA